MATSIFNSSLCIHSLFIVLISRMGIDSLEQLRMCSFTFEFELLSLDDCSMAAVWMLYFVQVVVLTVLSMICIVF